MSKNIMQDATIEKYFDSPIPTKKKLLYKNYTKLKENALSSLAQGTQKYDQNQYPRNASFARFPVMIKCKTCSHFTMTEIEYKHGKASKFWSFMLLPFLCTGACILCLTSCKDVRHLCGNCHNQVGRNVSSII